MSSKAKMHAVPIRENGREELQALCGRNTATIAPALRTIDPTAVSCARCRGAYRWSGFFVAALNR